MTISAISGSSLRNRGAWSGLSAYSAGDCTTNAAVGYLCYQAVAAPPGAAAPTLDPSAVVNTLGGVNISSLASGAFSTTNPALLCAVVQIEHGNTTLVTVSSIADTGTHTWTKRWALGTTNNGTHIEFWTAPAAAAVSAITVTATLSAVSQAGNSVTLMLFGLDGYNTSTPFDANAGLPYSNGFPSGALSVSTNYALDMVLWFGATTLTSPNVTPPTGYTTIVNSNNTNGSPAVQAVVAYQRQTTTLTNQSIGGGGYDIQVVDAIQGAAVTPNTAPASDPAHWAG